MLNSKRVSPNTLGSKTAIKVSYGLVGTPFGKMVLGFVGGRDDAICYLNFADSGTKDKENDPPAEYDAKLLKHWPNALLSKNVSQAQKIANEIFDEEELTINVLVAGTPFQESVWKELLKIPTGQTCTYGDIAERIGNPKAVRAVGTAVGSNAVSIVIPCHRVVSKNGAIKYGGGTERKIKLLKYEYEMSESW